MGLISCYNGGGGGFLKGGAGGKYSTTGGVVLCRPRNRLVKLAAIVKENWGKTGRGQEKRDVGYRRVLRRFP